MDKVKVNFAIVITFIFTFFSFEISFAKSTDKKQFIEMVKKPKKMMEENYQKMWSKEFINLTLQIDQKFNIEKINFTKKNKWFKADALLYICLGHRSAYQNKDMKIVIDKCKRADDYYNKNNLYFEKRADYKSWLHSIISTMYAWQYYIDGDKKNYRGAIKYNEINIKDIRKKDLFYSDALKTNVIIFRVSGEYDKAIKYQKLNLENWNCLKQISELPIGTQKRCMTELSDYAVLHMDKGGYENEKKAKKIIDDVINNETQENFDSNTRNSIRVALYQYYMNQQNFKSAEKTIYEAIEFIADKQGQEKGTIEMYYENMKRLYTTMISMGHIYEAKIGLEDLIIKIEKKYGSESILLIGPLEEWISLYNSFNYNIEELTLYTKKLIKILDKHKKNYKIGRDISLATVAGAFLELGDFKKAEKYFIESIKASVQEENNNLNLGLITSKIALKKFDEAKEILIKIKPQNTYQQIGYLSAQGLIYKNTGDLKNYISSFYENYLFYSNYAKGLISEKGAPSVQYYSRKIISQLHEATELPQEDYLKLKKEFNSVSMNSFDSAIIELFEILRTSKFNKRVANIIERSQNPKIEKEKRKLQELQIEFEKLPKIALNSDQTSEVIKNLKVSKEKIDQQKKLILSKIGGNKLNTYKSYSVKEIQKNINDSQVIISYFFDPENLYIIILSNNNFQIKKIRKKNKLVEDLIVKIRESLIVNNKGTIDKFDISNSNKLYNTIIKPIENHIQTKSELIIIPHKSLNSLPFEILLQSDTKNVAKLDYTNLSWFGKKFAINYFPSIYSYLELKNLPSNKSSFSFAGLGDPKFNKEKNLVSKKIDINKVMLRGVADPNEIRKLNELPETRQELNFIANIFKNNSKLFLGNEFTEDNIKSIDLSKFRFISFATHAVIANQIENIGEPGLILTPPTNANELNDGILTVSEIERLNLNSDIVILSACNTASKDGSPNANGLSGLVSAFFQAGTKSMLVTHWDVETNSAVELTTGTIKNLNVSNNLSSALQQTKILMMSNAETSHPFYWAPFVLIGDL